MSGSLLVLNSGSSSLKFSLFECAAGEWPPLLAHGEVAGIDERPELQLRGADGVTIVPDPPVLFDHGGHEHVLDLLDALFARLFQAHPLVAVGHRVVHGGAGRSEACRIDRPTLDALAQLIPLAPLHQGHNLAPIEAWLRRAPQMPQVAAFDTAFHQTIVPWRQRYPLPADLAGPAIRRYGFHGLSYQYLSLRLRAQDPAAGGRCVALHLGAGASMCALDHGISVSNSMGFTALDGLPMATRSGSLDPGLLLHLLDNGALAPQALRERLYHDSGLLALSDGISGDMRRLLDSPRPEAADAVRHFCWRARRELGAMAAELGGLDSIVFTAGIGEHAAPVRAEILRGLEFLGIELDAHANAAHADCISSPASAVRVLVMATNEEAMIARQMQALLA